MEEPAKISEPIITYATLDDRSALFLIDSIKKGIEYAFFETLARKLPFTTSDWASLLHLSERSLQRYKKENSSFGPVSSERIVEVVMLYKYGTEVFGGEEAFNAWLGTKNVALGNLKPQDLLDSSLGIGLVKDELTRIEQGILA